MVGIVAALYDEVMPLLRGLRYCRHDGIGQYLGEFGGQQVSVYLCKPGVAKKTQFRRWLGQHRFAYVINIGLAGGLHAGLRRGQAYPIARASLAGQKDLILAAGGSHVFTNDDPVFSLGEKEDIYLLSQADLVDMETYWLWKIWLEEKPSLRAHDFLVSKIAVDLPGDENYLRVESKFRNFFTEKKFLQKIKIILSTGLLNSLYVYRRKKAMQRAVHEELARLLAGLPAPGQRS